MKRLEIIAELRAGFPIAYGESFKMTAARKRWTDEQLLDWLIIVRLRVKQAKQIQDFCDNTPKPPTLCVVSAGVPGPSSRLNECGGGRRVLHGNKSLQ